MEQIIQSAHGRDKAHTEGKIKTMNPLQLMELHKPRFTRNDEVIYQTIAAKPEQMIHMTTSALAEVCGVSQPALSRFVKMLGYSRYQDFRADMITYLAKKNETDMRQSGHQGYFHTLYQVLEEAEKLLTEDCLKELLHYMDSFDHIFATGMGKSFHPAQLLQILSYKTGRNIQALSRDILLEAGDYMGANDLLMIFSVSGTSQSVRDITRIAGKIMLITANPHHMLQDMADRVLILPYIPPDPEESSVSPVLFDVLVELLVSFMIREGRPETEL